jgi:hypothetical protein
MTRKASHDRGTSRQREVYLPLVIVVAFRVSTTQNPIREKFHKVVVGRNGGGRMAVERGQLGAPKTGFERARD